MSEGFPKNNSEKKQKPLTEKEISDLKILSSQGDEKASEVLRRAQHNAVKARIKNIERKKVEAEDIEEHLIKEELAAFDIVVNQLDESGDVIPDEQVSIDDVEATIHMRVNELNLTNNKK